ncbi:TOMM precursor leader peptide-binding protein, partial [Arthrobacter sp. GCM10027362]|uniref:TOMM precursor leader peptide-binding protein n=1 Tax=Arthrobacter sp. GCM10027362 TaxID=3273379 RepID=UPI00363355AC
SAGILACRGAAVVHVLGLGRTGAAVACALAAAGIGTLLLEDPLPVGPPDVGAGAYRLADIGLNRTQALRRLVHQIDPTISCHPISRTAAGSGAGLPRILSLAVYAAADVPDADVGAALMSRGHPHLCVLSREQDALVGPLVVPGQSACLECLNRHHADADPEWYELSAGLAAQAAGASVDEVSLSVAAAGLAALQALLYVDGRNQPAAWSAVLQLRPVDGTVARHEYPPHPGCGCTFGPNPAPAA